jgi:uncharacterized protein
LIAYFDTSAVVPLLVDDEPGLDACRRVWTLAESLIASRLVFVETAAALAQAARLGRLTAAAHARALAGLEHVWVQFEIIEIGDDLIRRAAMLAHAHALRGFDAVHCAAALTVSGPSTVAVSGDRTLLSAWRANGVAVIDTLA